MLTEVWQGGIITLTQAESSDNEKVGLREEKKSAKEELEERGLCLSHKGGPSSRPL